MSSNIEHFANKLLYRCERRASAEVARYVFENRGKSLDEIVQGCIKNNALKSKIERFSQDVHKIMCELLSINLYKKQYTSESTDEFRLRLKKEIFQKAINQGIPLKKKEELGDWFSGDYRCSHLDLKGLDDADAIKECFKWINCVTEVCCGEPMFLKIEQQNVSLENSQNIQDKNVSLQASGEKDQEEDPLYNAWIQGYLQCNLMSR